MSEQPREEGPGAAAPRAEDAYQWETSKENLQPVKMGRSAAALKQASDLVSGDSEKVNQATDAFNTQKK